MEYEKWSVESSWVFRDKEYTVGADVQDDLLVVKVEEVETADRWKGQFEPKHIEELTRKTGNYKKFPIFLNMLESAITKSSESVTLDLLTCGDLEAMWEKRLGSGKVRGGLSPTSKPQAKRYLILTYDVEFDRIHYPLALPYCGRPDPARLQDTVRKLQAELELARKQVLGRGNHSALAQLQEENMLLKRAKKQIEADFLAYKREVTLLRDGNSSKEVKILKKVVKNLEEEILKEHSKHQKYVSKKNAEIKQLLEEIEELRLSERSLKSKVRNLTHELASAKHVYRISPVISVRRPLERRRSDPGERNFSARRFSNPKLTSSGSRISGARKPRRQPSTENVRFPSKSRTPSPSSARFDPTAYVERKRRQQLEIDTRLGKLKTSKKSRSRSNSTEKQCYKKQTSSRTRPSYPLFSRNCNSSQASSYQSSAESASDDGSDVGFSKQPKEVSGVQRSSEAANLVQRKEMTEIDARLNALQEFMKRSLESARNYSRK